MSNNVIDIPKVSIRTADCLREAMELIKGQYWLFVGICAVGTILGSIVPLNILLGPFMCGIYLCLFQRLNGEPVQFETLFKGFNYFVESLIVTMILTGASLIIFLPAYLILFLGALSVSSSGGAFPALSFILAFAVFFLFIMIISVVAGVFFVFAFPLIVDRGMKAIPAMKTSVQAGMANFGGLLALVLLVMVISFIAALFCYLPVFLVLPVTMGAMMIAYRRVFPGKMEKSECLIPEDS